VRVPKPLFEQTIGVPLLTVLFIYSNSTDLVGGGGFAILGLLLLNVLSCRSVPKQKILFLIYNLTFFLFLSARTLVYLLMPEVADAVPRPFFTPEIERQVNILLFLSLLITRVFFSASFRFTAILDHKPSSDEYITKIRSISKKLIVPTIVLNVAVLAEKIAFVTAYGYESYYVSFTSGLPTVLIRVAGLYPAILFLYLATFPNRRATYIQLLLYACVAALSLGYGQRNGFILGLVFVVIYLAIRDVLTPERKPWLSKKLLLLGAQMLIPLIIFLAAFTYIRSDLEIVDQSTATLIGRFLASQGGVIFNLGHTIDLNDQFPPWRFYSAGPVIGFLKENIIATTVFGATVFPNASPELAIGGHNFSFALAYIVNPSYYALGGGFGSNFISELWIDFGTAGVVVGSALFGLLLGRFTSMLRRGGPFFIAFMFAGALELIYAPRAEFLGFISPFLSMPTIAVYVTIHMIVRKSRKRVSRISNGHLDF